MCKRNGRIEIKRTKELFNVLEPKVCISQMSYTRRVTGKTLHIIDRIRAGFLPTIADSPNIFFMIGPEEIDGAEDIFALIGGCKCSAASVVRSCPNLFLLSALRK